MDSRNIGRVLGIGVRVAGRIAGQQINAQAQPSATAPSYRPAPSAAPVHTFAHGQAAAQKTKQLAAQARVASRSASGFLRPFRRLGGILWLEITGAFFLLFAILFVARLWQNWAGTSHYGRAITSVAAAVFFYLGISSFWRARRS